MKEHDEAETSTEMKINLSGATVAGLVIGSTVIAVASIVISLVAIVGTRPGDKAQPVDSPTFGVPHIVTGTVGHGEPLAAVADFLGLELEGLKAQLKDGSTIAELAGDDLDGLIAHQLELAGERIAGRMNDGRGGMRPGGLRPGGMGHGRLRPGGMGAATDSFGN